MNTRVANPATHSVNPYTKDKKMKSNHNYYVYIVVCKDGSYYTGITNDIDQRLWQHNTGIDKNCYTFSRRPIELKYLQHFQQVEEAIKWEKELKGWSRRKKQALIEKDWDRIREFAKSSNPVSTPGNPSTSSG
jgi:putative endonuclease